MMLQSGESCTTFYIKEFCQKSFSNFQSGEFYSFPKSGIFASALVPPFSVWWILLILYIWRFSCSLAIACFFYKFIHEPSIWRIFYFILHKRILSKKFLKFSIWWILFISQIWRFLHLHKSQLEFYFFVKLQSGAFYSIFKEGFFPISLISKIIHKGIL